MRTNIGTPVQFFQWSHRLQDWICFPAVISGVKDAHVNITKIGARENETFEYVRHADFKQKESNYWDFLPQDKMAAIGL